MLDMHEVIGSIPTVSTKEKGRQKSRPFCYGEIVWMRSNVQGASEAPTPIGSDQRERRAACTPSEARVGSDSMRLHFRPQIRGDRKKIPFFRFRQSFSQHAFVKLHKALIPRQFPPKNRSSPLLKSRYDTGTTNIPL